jgi:hypothetical protein
MRRLPSALLLALLCAACSRNENADERYGYDRSLEPLLAAAGTDAQVFVVDNSKDTVLFGERGTIVSIPADCFEQTNGPIDVHLIEAPEMSDLVLLNAPTISEGRLLETDGVVYVNAFANGAPVKVKDDERVEIEVPSDHFDESMGSFVGTYDKKGRLNWHEGNEMATALKEEVKQQLTYEFLTIPMELFPNRAQYFRMDSIARAYPWKNGELSVPDADLLIGKERAAFYADAVKFLQDPAAENTPLATREFAERLGDLQDYYYYWYWPQPDGSAKLKYDVFGPFQHRIFQVYLSNMDKDLWYSDSLALRVMDEWVPRNKKDSTERKSYERSLERFTEFKKQRLTKPVTIDDHGVDLNTQTAYRDLLDKGVEKNEARRLLDLHGIRQQAIAQLRTGQVVTAAAIAAEDARIEEERKGANIRYYLISANQLGWINVDRFYDNESAKECEVIAQVDLPRGVDRVNVSMVFAKSKTLIDGFRSDDGSYYFTQDDEYYRRLPVGEEATMIAIAYQDGKPFLAMKKITIAEKMNERLELTAMAVDDFKAALKQLN